MSLVWVLYGNKMEAVDEVYKKQIKESGGYSRYAKKSRNENVGEGEAYWVEVTFGEVEIPEMGLSEVRIRRTYEDAKEWLRIDVGGEEYQFEDGSEKEIKDQQERFIQENILPIEIAKFFFFDAEKIVSFAELGTQESRKQLSRSYSEVLGIQKYEKLKATLEGLRSKFKNKAADGEKKEELRKLTNEIEQREAEISEIERELDENETEAAYLKGEIEALEEFLIRQGGGMDEEELRQIREEKAPKENEVSAAGGTLKDLYEFIPLGIGGGLLTAVVEQIEKEQAWHRYERENETARYRAEELLDEMDKRVNEEREVSIDRDVKRYYEKVMGELLEKYYYSAMGLQKPQMIHEMGEREVKQLGQLKDEVVQNGQRFEQVKAEYDKALQEKNSIEQKLRKAEAKSQDEIVQGKKQEKKKHEVRKDELTKHAGELGIRKENAQKAITQAKKRCTMLEDAIKVGEDDREKDKVALQLIKRINEFLNRFKKEKASSLETRILKFLNELWHKKDLVGEVKVGISGVENDVDIELYKPDGGKLDNGGLSMGEKQMFSSALLGALVEETGIDFPVFIDSPLQKLDKMHTRNLLEKFYPKISRQVVIFPLLGKELTEGEYDIMKGYVAGTFLIKHTAEGSGFEEVSHDELFEAYEKMNHHAN